jgi:hypothetical protein
MRAAVGLSIFDLPDFPKGAAAVLLPTAVGEEGEGDEEGEGVEESIHGGDWEGLGLFSQLGERSPFNGVRQHTR